MNTTEARKANEQRRDIIRENKARRMRAGIKQAPLPVPDVATADCVPIAYSASGDYIGRLESAEDCPRGCIVKFEAALY